MTDRPRSLSVLLVLVLNMGNLGAARSAEPAAPPQKSYPHVNLAASYVVDAAWPQRPQGMEWGQIPGIAVDAHDQIWLFVRAKPPVQVYDAAGKLVRAWDNEYIDHAHGIRFGPDGTVWLADNRTHVVMQFTPEGKLLKVLGVPRVPGDDLAHFNRPPTWRSHRRGTCLWPTRRPPRTIGEALS